MEQRRRIIIAMMDGFSMDYFRKSDIPFIKSMARDGFFAEVRGMFPSVTNANNTSIATGVWPRIHGISANSLYDRTKKTQTYLNDSAAIRVPTLFDRARERGLKTAVLTSKRKTKELFAFRADIVIAAEALSEDEKKVFGPAPLVYSAEINHWLWDAAAMMFRDRSDISLIYVHTTDYPMHAWAPESEESLSHLRGIDHRMAVIHDTFPDVSFFLTADHGMNSKKLNWDLMRACGEAGCPIEFSLSPERDYYARHHKNYSGCAWVWLKNQSDLKRVRDVISALEGVEAVLNAADVAKLYNLDPCHLGDLVVFGDKNTMFGESETTREILPGSYRAHGSLHEMDVPLIIYNYPGPLPPKTYFKHNKDLAAFLFSGAAEA